MKKKEIQKVLRKLGLRPIDQSNDWVGSTCPLAPLTHATKVDSNPSFGVMAVKGESTYNCLACHSTGMLKYLPRKVASIPGTSPERQAELMALAQEIEQVEEGYLFMDDEPDPEEIDNPLMWEIYGNMYPPVGAFPEAVAYCKKRGMTFQATVDCKAKYDPEYRRIVFPVIDPNGDLYGYTGRDVTESARAKVLDYAGLKKSRHILGTHLWTQGKPALIIEGVMGYASLISHRFHDTFNVGAIMGSQMSEIQAALIANYNTEVYLMLDNDAAGERGLWDNKLKPGAVRLMDNRPCAVKVPVWPTGKKDPDELRQEDIPSILDAELAFLHERY